MSLELIVIGRSISTISLDGLSGLKNCDKSDVENHFSEVITTIIESCFNNDPDLYMPALNSINTLIADVDSETLEKVHDDLVVNMEKFLMTGNSSEQSLALSIMSHLFSQKLPNMKILIKTFLLVNSAHEDSRTEVVKVLTNLAKVKFTQLRLLTFKVDISL